MIEEKDDGLFRIKVPLGMAVIEEVLEQVLQPEITGPDKPM